MTRSNDRPTIAQKRKLNRLPRVLELAAEGLGSRAIGQKLGLSKSAVNDLLRTAAGGLPNQGTARPAGSHPQEDRVYTLIRDELLEEWRRSKNDKQVQVVEETGPADDPAAAKKKRSLRTETRAGNAAFLTKAMEAQNRIDALQEQLDRLLGQPNHAPTPLAELTDDDLEKLTDDDLDNFTDDQLFEIGARMHARHGLTTPLLTREKLAGMTGAELAAEEIRWQAETDALDAEDADCGAGIPPAGEPPPAGTGDPQADLAPPQLLGEPAKVVPTAVAAPASAPAEGSEKAAPPPLTWEQRREAVLRQSAEIKRRRKRYTDPWYCAYGAPFHE